MARAPLIAVSPVLQSRFLACLCFAVGLKLTWRFAVCRLGRFARLLLLPFPWSCRSVWSVSSACLLWLAFAVSGHRSSSALGPGLSRCAGYSWVCPPPRVLWCFVPSAGRLGSGYRLSRFHRHSVAVAVRLEVLAVLGWSSVKVVSLPVWGGGPAALVGFSGLAVSPAFGCCGRGSALIAALAWCR